MKVGFIGVGFMGRHMARNIAAGGFEMTVFDIRKEAAEELLSMGATWAESPAAVAAASDVVFTSLPRPQDVEEVALGEGGILSGAGAGTVYFDLSTTDPDTIYRVSAAGESAGVTVLDAPVSGGVGGAEAGTLCVMVGGDEDAYLRCKPVLDRIGDKVMRCGDLGSGAICKIVNNLIGLSVGVLLSEAFSLGVKAGVDAQTLFDAVKGSSGNTQSMQGFPVGAVRGELRARLSARPCGEGCRAGDGYGAAAARADGNVEYSAAALHCRAEQRLGQGSVRGGRKGTGRAGGG